MEFSSSQLHQGRLSAIQRLQVALDQDKRSRFQFHADDDAVNPCSVSEEEEMKYSSASQVAGKVASRLRHAEQRIQKAEELAFNFANEVETLRLQLEKEELINSEHEISEHKVRELEVQVRQYHEEKALLESELQKFKRELESLRSQHEDLKNSTQTEKDELQNELIRLQTEKKIADEMVEKLTRRLSASEASLENQRKELETRIQHSKSEQTVEKSILVSKEAEWEQLVCEHESIKAKAKKASEQIEELNRLVRIGESARQDADETKEKLKLELEGVTARKHQLDQRVQGVEDELRLTKRSLDLAIEQRNEAESKVDNLKSKLRSAKKKASKEASEREHVESLVENLRQVASSSSSATKEATAKLARKEEQVVTLEHRIQELKSANERLRNERRHLATRLDQARSDVARATQEHRVVDQSARRAVSELTTLSRRASLGYENLEESPLSSRSEGLFEEVDRRQEELEKLRESKALLQQQLAMSDIEAKELKKQVSVEQQRSRDQERRIRSLRAQLSDLQRLNEDQLAQNKLSLQAKEAESEYVWQKLEEALNKDKQDEV